jgi:hypothetical protein
MTEAKCASSGLRQDRRDPMGPDKPHALIAADRSPTMFKILELKNAVSAPASEVGRGFSTREEALVAVKKHLKTFNVSGHNPEGDYWWVRDAEGLRKCWIASAE